MSLDLDRSTRLRVKFGDVARQVKVKVDPDSGEVERYIAGEHMETDNLRITRWGTVGDGYLGPAFHARFKPGQVLYGSRRTYLRKVAFADFDGVCANTTFVIESRDPAVLLPEVLPFVMSTEAFHSHSKNESKGSVNPYVNWPDIAKYEFDLPPLAEQRRIADLLWAVERQGNNLSALQSELRSVGAIAADARVAKAAARHPSRELHEVISISRPLCYGVVQPGLPVDGGVPLVRVCDMESETIDFNGLRTVSAQVDAEYKRSRLREGDILVSVVGTIGRVQLATSEMTGFNIARAVARIAPDVTQVQPDYLAFVLRTSAYQSHMERAAFESARKTLNLSALGGIRVPVPPIEEQSAFLAASAATVNAYQAAAVESDAVQLMRSALLEKFVGWPL